MSNRLDQILMIPYIDMEISRPAGGYPNTAMASTSVRSRAGSRSPHPGLGSALRFHHLSLIEGSIFGRIHHYLPFTTDKELLFRSIDPNNLSKDGDENLFFLSTQHSIERECRPVD